MSFICLMLAVCAGVSAGVPWSSFVRVTRALGVWEMLLTTLATSMGSLGLNEGDGCRLRDLFKTMELHKRYILILGRGRWV